MHVVIVRNTPAARMIQRLGRQNREFYKESDIERARDALLEGGHTAEIWEADQQLVERLRQRFAPPGAHPLDRGIVFNLAYGVQGECRYTHVPSILEWLGVPYVGSGPRGHTICLDKYLAKLLLAHADLPTPACQLLGAPGEPLADGLDFPLIVKPQFESTSFGLRVIRDREALDAAVAAIVDSFAQPALVEAFVPGREVNCGILGNDPPQPLPVLEIDFGEVAEEQRILSFEAKRDRVVTHVCPAPLPAGLAERVQQLAVAAFRALGCNDAARVDFRVDSAGEPWILELNSMVAIHGASSYFDAARETGLSYTQMINRILGVAVARYR